MANSEHLKTLRQGIEAWNQWRQDQPQIHPDLRGANLDGEDYSKADLSGADLSGAILNETKPCGANLSQADLSQADLSQADLPQANLSKADLSKASFSEADLLRADLSRANLSGANLSGAILQWANFHRASLREAVFSDADLSDTVLTNTDLSEVKGLESIIHHGPSSIGIDTLYKSQGRIPDKFLRDTGVSEEIIDIARSMRNGPPTQWYSCFISYSTKDEEFAQRLHSRMRQANMRVWFAPKDLQGGKKMHEELFQAIQLQDKLLLVLSAHSIQSEWVMTEIRKARDTEKKENRRKLFPIRLVDFDALRAWTCSDADSGKDLAQEVREYFIPDFSNWKDAVAFEAAFTRLQTDLKYENAGTRPPAV